MIIKAVSQLIILNFLGLKELEAELEGYKENCNAGGMSLLLKENERLKLALSAKQAEQEEARRLAKVNCDVKFEIIFLLEKVNR